MMVAALLGAAVIVGGLTSVEEHGEALAVAGGSTLELQVAGVAGVPADAVAVALNMTVVNAQAAGFATVYPCGQPRPEASNLNYAAGQTIPNLVIAKPGVGGKVCIYTFAAVDVLADVSGFFPAGSGFTAVPNPTRVLDTRNGVGAPVAPVAAGSTLELQVAGVAGVPSNSDAVVLNMTIVNAQAPGFATVYPCGQSRPEASNLNYAAGQTIPNLVIAKPGVGGKVCVYTSAVVDVLADVSGFFPAGSGFTPVPNPTRVLDTRNGVGAPVAPVVGGSTLELQVAGVAGVPADAVAVALNMTVVNAQAAGFATVYPCGQPRPEASNLNYAAEQTIPNLVIAKPGVGGKVCIYTFAAVDVLADVSGFFPAGSGFTPIPNPVRILDSRSVQPPPELDTRRVFEVVSVDLTARRMTVREWFAPGPIPNPSPSQAEGNFLYVFGSQDNWSVGPAQTLGVSDGFTYERIDPYETSFAQFAAWANSDQDPSWTQTFWLGSRNEVIYTMALAWDVSGSGECEEPRTLQPMNDNC